MGHSVAPYQPQTFERRMQTKEFLQSIWPDDGYYCICGKDQKNIVIPKFVSSIDEAVEVSKKLLDDKQDVYFACSSWIDPTERKGVNAKEQIGRAHV